MDKASANRVKEVSLQHFMKFFYIAWIHLRYDVYELAFNIKGRIPMRVDITLQRRVARYVMFPEAKQDSDIECACFNISNAEATNQKPAQRKRTTFKNSIS